MWESYPALQVKGDKYLQNMNSKYRVRKTNTLFKMALRMKRMFFLENVQDILENVLKMTERKRENGLQSSYKLFLCTSHW